MRTVRGSDTGIHPVYGHALRNRDFPDSGDHQRAPELPFRKVYQGIRSGLADTRGEGYLRAAAVFLALVIVFSVVVWFSETVSLVAEIRRCLGVALDGTAVRASLQAYANEDDGPEQWMEYYSADDFLNLFLGQFAAAERVTDGVSLRSETGETLWELRAVTLIAPEPGKIRLRASAELRIPVSFAGVPLTELCLPVTVRSTNVPKM